MANGSSCDQSREDQVADWPNHKAPCRLFSASKQTKLYEKPAHVGVPPLQELKVLLDDWSALHYFTVKSALAAFVQGQGSNFNHLTHYVVFDLDYRRECEKNPSTTFMPKTFKLQKDPAPGTDRHEACVEGRKWLEELWKSAPVEPGCPPYIMCECA